MSQFNSLLSGKRPRCCVLYAFDLLWLNGHDLREVPLLDRKRHLCELVRSSKCDRILYAQHIESNGKKFFEAICARDLEGIVAKRKTGLYRDTSVNDGRRLRTGIIRRPRGGTNSCQSHEEPSSTYTLRNRG